MNKVVFLDRDGTINIDKDYLYKIEDFEYLPGVKEGLKMFQDAGYKLIIVTNQSGIGRGYYTEKEYKELESWLVDDLRRDGINITALYFCPHHPEAAVPEYRRDCDCRKPKLGMFEQAIKEYDIDINNSIAIGDKLRDLEICNIKNGNTKGYLVYSDIEKKEGNIKYIKEGILEAANLEILGGN